MATSGVNTFSISRDTILREALSICGIIDETETPTAEMTSRGQITLNMMTKSWLAQGYHLWGLQECNLILADGQHRYSLSTTGDRFSANATITTLTAAASSGATTLTLDSTGMTAADIIGIVQDDGTVKWTTIATVPGATSVTITAALTDDAASGALVYTYTSRTSRPLRIQSAGVIVDDIETPLSIISRQEYFDLPTKTTSEGQPTQVYYDPQLGSGVLYVWPVPDANTYYLRITCERNLEDFTATADEPDFPIEWGEALCWGLACRLAPKYGVPMDKLAGIKMIADEHLQTALDFDRENVSIFMTPDSRYA